MLNAGDDWNRLLGIGGLLALGEGTPELCAERSRLLDLSLKEPDSFRWPEGWTEATFPPRFHEEWPDVVRAAFLHELGNPWLQPEWFDRDQRDDPSAPAYYFCVPPREFFRRLAPSLPPETCQKVLEILAQADADDQAALDQANAGEEASPDPAAV